MDRNAELSHNFFFRAHECLVLSAELIGNLATVQRFSFHISLKEPEIHFYFATDVAPVSLETNLLPDNLSLLGSAYRRKVKQTVFGYILLVCKNTGTGTLTMY